MVPKPKNNANATRASQPVAQIKIPARVHAACTRCRMKKVKCDGVTPCLRCTQDGVLCTAKKAPADARAASSEHMREMEIQQSNLMKALTNIVRRVRQPVGEADVKQIMETVKECGFAFEGVGDNQLCVARPVYETLSATTTTTNLNKSNVPTTRKRKREGNIPSVATSSNEETPAQWNEYADLTSANMSPIIESHVEDYEQEEASKRQRAGDPFDASWNLDPYAAPYQTPHTTAEEPTPLSQQDFASKLNTQYVNALPNSNMTAGIPGEPVYYMQSQAWDWNSTLWWDPFDEPMAPPT